MGSKTEREKLHIGVLARHYHIAKFYFFQMKKN
jgi:hypothetical protein